jgi:hypothetical protein
MRCCSRVALLGYALTLWLMAAGFAVLIPIMALEIWVRDAWARRRA